MTTVVKTLLQCDGVGHGGQMYSTTIPEIARLLDGWCTVNSDLNPDHTTGNEHDLCPWCSVEIFVAKVCTMILGLPSCGYEMEHRHNADYGEPRALFVWKLYPDDNGQDQCREAMVNRREGWISR